ncbi:hypothetical protein [Oricola indica]|uniref:hypothetical protein n=1 Tax=Oricola indica TaxID=2872591 RepID=UPI003CCC453C
MPGKIPEGCIDLKEAFDAYYERRFGVPEHRDNSENKAWRQMRASAELRRAFRRNEVQVRVRFDGDNESMSLPAGGWGADKFEFGLIMEGHPIDLTGHSKKWERYQDEVPFVDSSELDQWAQRVTGGRRSQGNGGTARLDINEESGAPESEAECAETRNRARAKPGRPHGYDWESFYSEAVEQIANEGNVSSYKPYGFNKSTLSKRMAEWCAREWRTEPAPSTIATHINEALRRYEESFDSDNSDNSDN